MGSRVGAIKVGNDGDVITVNYGQHQIRFDTLLEICIKDGNVGCVQWLPVVDLCEEVPKLKEVRHLNANTMHALFQRACNLTTCWTASY